MGRIDSYQILSSHWEQGLNEAVNAAIADGWQPFGSVGVSLSVSSDSHGNQKDQKVFCQAMVKHEGIDSAPRATPVETI